MRGRPSAIKIFGERNTGTRLLSLLIEKNLGLRCMPGTAAELDPAACARISGDAEAGLDAIFHNVDAAHAWKHCATNFADVAALDDCLTIFLVKHPLSWLASLFERPYHLIGSGPASIEEFAAMSWQTVARENLECRAFKPFDLYREKIASYLALASRTQSMFVRFEDLVLDQEAVLRDLGCDGAIVGHEPSTKASGRTAADYRAYYAEERWRERVAEVAEQPDWSQVQRFGYS